MPPTEVATGALQRGLLKPQGHRQLFLRNHVTTTYLECRRVGILRETLKIA